MELGKSARGTFTPGDLFVRPWGFSWRWSQTWLCSRLCSRRYKGLFQKLTVAQGPRLEGTLLQETLKLKRGPLGLVDFKVWERSRRAIFAPLYTLLLSNLLLVYFVFPFHCCVDDTQLHFTLFIAGFLKTFPT